MTDIFQTTFIYKSNLKKRILASVIDYGIFVLVNIVYFKYFGHEKEDGVYVINGLPALVPPIFWFCYFVITEAWYGATLGHHALNLKVLTIERKQIGLGQAFKRHLLDFIDIFSFSGIPAIIAIKNTDRKQRLGDLWAKTIVVDTTDPEQYSKIT